MALKLIHTAHVHCATFDALRDRIAPGVELQHQVKTDWLTRAQGGIDDALSLEISDVLKEFSDPVICSCTTIGRVAGAAGAIRVDQPMMREAARLGGTIVMAYCLDSTREPSLTLLNEAIDEARTPAHVQPLALTQHWPLFEANQAQAFAAALAEDIRQAVGQLEKPGSVVLAQASMAGAAMLLEDLGVPVLSSPELALRAALARI